MASLRLIDDNLDAYNRFEDQQSKAEAESERRNELITWVSDAVQEAINILQNPEELEDLSKVLDDAMEQLEDLIGRLEGER